jgi:hypothetical protein
MDFEAAWATEDDGTYGFQFLVEPYAKTVGLNCEGANPDPACGMQADLLFCLIREGADQNDHCRPFEPVIPITSGQ